MSDVSPRVSGRLDGRLRLADDRPMSDDIAQMAGEARSLWRGQPTAALATAGGPDGWPYASLVLAACDQDGAPLLLLSGLAEHTRNLRRDPRVSLLFDGTIGLEERLTGARVSLLGRIAVTTEPRHRARFLNRHPSAAAYADFGDFAFYRVEPLRAHLVAGFGRIRWLEQDQLRIATADELLAAEESIVAHMNEDHADAVALYATRLLGRTGDGWRMTGIDPEGCDLAGSDATARLGFGRRVETADAARAELVRLARAARAA